MSGFNTDPDIETTETREETDKKCPSCGGVMNFDPATGGLFCPYCEYQEKIPVARGADGSAAELRLEDAAKKENCDWGASKKIVLCKACGAESIYDDLQIASVCPFCGSNQVMEAADQDTIAPGGVVPFQISDEKASQLFLQWIKKRWFCPKLAKESAKAKSFHGVYLPYWTFDTETESTYRADYGKDRTVNRNGERKTVTDWRPTAGSYREKIDDELVVGTTNHNQSMLRGLEPFDTAANRTYKPEYIAGFAAERYAVGIQEAWEQAKSLIKFRLRDNIERAIKKKHSADRVRQLNFSTTYQNVTYKYLLLPIWISHYKYQEKVYHFMVNGQTGKVSGKTPISPVKVAITIAAALAALAIALWFFGS